MERLEFLQAQHPVVIGIQFIENLLRSRSRALPILGRRDLTGGRRSIGVGLIRWLDIVGIALGFLPKATRAAIAGTARICGSVLITLALAIRSAWSSLASGTRRAVLKEGLELIETQHSVAIGVEFLKEFLRTGPRPLAGSLPLPARTLPSAGRGLCDGKSAGNRQGAKGGDEYFHMRRCSMRHHPAKAGGTTMRLTTFNMVFDRKLYVKL
jgi:hypothetical protein